MTRYRVLTDESANVKFLKSAGSEWMSVGLSLAPHKLSGHNVCAHASDACIAHCVAFAGNGAVFPVVMRGRIAKTQALFRDQAAFAEKLRLDLRKAVRVAAQFGRRVACRLNVFSDLPWERIAPDLFTEFSDVQFYDYTKSLRRAYGMTFDNGLTLPKNYHLTFSRSEVNECLAIGLLMQRVNVAVVFPQFRGTPLPCDWHGFPVIDGEENDLRFLDPRGCVVGLRAKGTMRGDSSGMVDRSPNHNLLDVLS